MISQATLGRLCFAISMMAFGIQQLVTAQFVRVVPPLPAWMPAPGVWAYGIGILLILTGAALASGIRGREAAVVLSGLIVLAIVLLHLPRAFAEPGVGFHWTNPCKALALLGGVLIVAATLPVRPMDGSARLARGFERLAPLESTLFLAAFLILGGIQHFVYVTFVMQLVPAWIPGPRFWVYLTGTALIAGGIGILLSPTRRLAATLVGIMILLWVVLLHIPRAFASPQDPGETSAIFEALALSGGGVHPGRAASGGGGAETGDAGEAALAGEPSLQRPSLGAAPSPRRRLGLARDQQELPRLRFLGQLPEAARSGVRLRGVAEIELAEDQPRLEDGEPRRAPSRPGRGRPRRARGRRRGGRRRLRRGSGRGGRRGGAGSAGCRGSRPAPGRRRPRRRGADGGRSRPARRWRAPGRCCPTGASPRRPGRTGGRGRAPPPGAPPRCAAGRGSSASARRRPPPPPSRAPRGRPGRRGPASARRSSRRRGPTPGRPRGAPRRPRRAGCGRGPAPRCSRAPPPRGRRRRDGCRPGRRGRMPCTRGPPSRG